MSLLLCVSCTPEAETICVEPSSLRAECKLASYPIEITSNSVWTVKMDDADKSWISLPENGDGNEKLNVRILKNQYRSSRSANVQFVTPGGVSATLAIEQAGDPLAKEKQEVTVRLGTYNLRMEQSDEAADNKWAVRKDRLLTSIKENDFDIFGVQEVNTTMQNWAKTNLGTDYGIFFFSPYNQSGSGDKAQGILYRSKDFELVKKGFFWACSTPDAMTKNDVGDSGSFYRGGCWVILKHKGSGVQLFFMNTHGCLNSQPNKDNAVYYSQIEKKYNTDGLPSFFVGDMNARPTYDAIATFKTWWKDLSETVPAAKKTGPENTYNGFSSQQGKYRLDYIFGRGDGITPVEYCTNNKLYNGMYASDHFPVWADVKISR